MKSVSSAPTRWTRPNGASPASSRARAPLELVVDRRVAQAAQHREPGRGRERVPGERARLVDGADRREQVHDLGAPAEGRERQPAADDLPEHGQVGRDAEALLRAAARDPEAGDHLVEDEQRAARVAEPAQRLEVAAAPAGRRPCSPATGSTMTRRAPRRAARNASAAASRSLYGTTIVSAAAPRRDAGRGRDRRASRAPSRRSRAARRRGRGSRRRS